MRHPSPGRGPQRRQVVRGAAPASAAPHLTDDVHRHLRTEPAGSTGSGRQQDDLLFGPVDDPIASDDSPAIPQQRRSAHPAHARAAAAQGAAASGAAAPADAPPTGHARRRWHRRGHGVRRRRPAAYRWHRRPSGWRRARPPTRRSPSTAPRFSYRPALDGLRALAVVGVMLLPRGPSSRGTPSTSCPAASSGWTSSSCLSGYLITTLLLSGAGRARAASIFQGLLDPPRAKRLVPALLTATAGISICMVFLLPARLRRPRRSRASAATRSPRSSTWRTGTWPSAASRTSTRFADPSLLRHMWSFGDRGAVLPAVADHRVLRGLKAGQALPPHVLRC